MHGWFLFTRQLLKHNIEMFADTSSDFFSPLRNLSCVVDYRSEMFAAHPVQIFVVDFY